MIPSLNLSLFPLLSYIFSRVLFFCSSLTSLRLVRTHSLSSLSITPPPSSLNACGYWLCGVRAFQPHKNLMAGIISPLNWACFAFAHSHIQRGHTLKPLCTGWAFSPSHACLSCNQSYMLLLGFCLDTHDTDGWMRGNLNEQLHKITYGRSQGLEHVEREETEKRRLEEMRSETYADERQEREGGKAGHFNSEKCC